MGQPPVPVKADTGVVAVHCVAGLGRVGALRGLGADLATLRFDASEIRVFNHPGCTKTLVK